MALLRQKIPEKVREKLEKAFCKAFEAVFEYGDDIIEKSYARDREKRRFMARDLNFIMDGDSKSLRGIENSGSLSDWANTVLTTVEGVGLGALGVGIPDIILFVAMLLRGVREAAAQYGRHPDSDSEKILTLCLLETVMLSGAEWERADSRVEQMLSGAEIIPVNPQAAEVQLRRTAAAFATDLLVLKFIQGLPVVGLVGGFSNPVYYRRVMSYVRLKYERRYILDAMGRS